MATNTSVTVDDHNCVLVTAGGSPLTIVIPPSRSSVSITITSGAPMTAVATTGEQQRLPLQVSAT